MEINDILTLIALVVIPITAVLIGQYLQTIAKKREDENRRQDRIRDDKMQIFKTLMTERIYGRTESGVQALNLIDIVFSDSKNVRTAWKEYRASLPMTNVATLDVNDTKTKHHKLLEAISDDLGYKGKITWETIQNPFVPPEISNMWEEQLKSRKDYAQLQEGLANVISNPSLQSAMGSIIGTLSQGVQNKPLKNEETADLSDSQKNNKN